MSKKHHSPISLILNSENIYRSINISSTHFSSKLMLHLELFSMLKKAWRKKIKKKSEWGLEKYKLAKYC